MYEFFGKTETHREQRILSGTQENPVVELTTIFYSDGSRLELIHDHSNDHGEIREYDAQGTLMRITHGTFC